ncbi:MAG: hypothetical protein IPK34_17990 [Ramlibacter sp.]|jgi:hypothetical protein|nr:hypothetical protein [Ramlibacter sp.]
MTGSSARLELPVVKDVMTFGEQGVSAMAICLRRNGHRVVYLDHPEMVANHEVPENAGTKLLSLQEASSAVSLQSLPDQACLGHG